MTYFDPLARAHGEGAPTQSRAMLARSLKRSNGDRASHSTEVAP
jgi:hypothetical protein